MVYLEFEILRRRYQDTINNLDEILNEKEELFSRTQPKSVRYDKERVAGGQATNAFEEYVIAKERTQIEQRLAEAKALLDDRRTMLILKEEELRRSKDTVDRIYRMRFLDRWKVNRIASSIGYSESQIYRILRQIEVTIR